jgi:Mg2+ and Co2+ transporter CorA
MDKNELSERYFDAFDRMYYNLSEVIEMLHDEDGDPISDAEVVGEIVVTLRQYINLELDLIRELAKEYSDG